MIDIMLTVLSFVYNNLDVWSAASYHYDNYGGLINAIFARVDRQLWMCDIQDF